MRNFTLLFIFILLSPYTWAQSSGEIPTPRLWLRPDIGTITTNEWRDFRNNELYAAAAQGESPSLSGKLNYNRVFVFDGIDDYMRIPYSVEGLSRLTIITVFHSSDTTERGVIGAENAELRNTYLTTRRAKGPDDVTDHYGKHEYRAVLNTVTQNWNRSASTASTSSGGEEAFLALGSSGKSQDHKPFKGALAEVMVFDHALSFLDRIKVETYLALKYGTSLTIESGNYVSSKDHVLWSTEANKEYGHRIAGIGRDDGFGLYQKQSRSAYDTSFLIMSMGYLSKTNAENKATILDQNFVIWGDNNLPLTAKSGEGSDSLLSFIERKWMVQVTGETIAQQYKELRINLDMLPASAHGYWLVADRSGSGNFDPDNLEYIKVAYIERDKQKGNLAVYSNLRWDMDRSGKDVFGLAVAKNFYAVVRTLEQPLCDKRNGGRIAIEVLAGKAPYRYELKRTTGSKSETIKNWKGSSMLEELSSLGAGEYTLTVRNADNETVVRNFTLTWPEALHIDLGEDRIFTANEQITLDASTNIPASSAVTYLWESNKGFSSTEPKIDVIEPGLYKVSVTNEKGCVFTGEIGLWGDEHQFEVFPTVVHDGKYSIGISLQEAGDVSVKIFNSGGLLLQEMKGSGSAEYLFSAYTKEPGMYLVVMQSPKGIETKKVIVY